MTVQAITAAIAGMTLVCACALADPPQPVGARLWTAADVGSLAAALEAGGVPYTQILKGRTYGALLLRREVSGDPELHAKLNDFFVILSGEARIEVGGRVTGEKTVAPDEIRGRTLVGGTIYRVTQGDVLFVPADRWLQVLVPRGKVLQALIIKARS